MTFEEILPRLKAGHTCYRRSQHNLGLGDVKTDVNIRRVPGTYGGDANTTIGFIEVSCAKGSEHRDQVSEHFHIWAPTIEDILASDWEDATAYREDYEKELASRAEAAEAGKATAQESPAT